MQNVNITPCQQNSENKPKAYNVSKALFGGLIFGGDYIGCGGGGYSVVELDLDLEKIVTKLNLVPLESQ